MTTLINSYLSVSINESGAELCSVKNLKNNLEYIWKGDSAIWGRHSPVLFPIVGRLKENNYSVKGQKYSLPQHGFARDMPFKILEKSNSKIVFSLVYNEETLLKYPYKFELQISYILEGATLSVKYNVISLDTEKMFFSIGAHPGFTCPLDATENYEDYFLEFEKEEILALHLLQDGLISNSTVPFLKNEKKIPLSYELFKNDALVFKNYKSDFISLKHKSKGTIFDFHFKGYPFLGIWSKPGPFVCIEPWQGIADFVDHNGAIETKTGILSLDPKKNFECEWAVEIQQ